MFLLIESSEILISTFLTASREIAVCTNERGSCISLLLRASCRMPNDFAMIPFSATDTARCQGLEPMPQIQFPFFPEGVTHITSLLAFARSEGRITYFAGGMPVFSHDEKDLASFRMITAQFCENGNAKQADISRAFGVAKVTVKRAVKLYRDAGPEGFYGARKTRGPTVLTASVLDEAQALLDVGMMVPEVADRLSIKRDTLAKAVQASRLHVPSKKKTQR